MSPYHDTLAKIVPGTTVVLNMGFGPPRQSIESSDFSAYLRALSACLVAGYKSVIHEPTTEDDEYTLVTEGVFNEIAAASTLLFDGVEDSGQDCIAIYYPELGQGYLFGPHFSEWGGFDYALFKKPL